MSCFVFSRYFVVISINTNFFIPLYRDPLNFVLAAKGDFDHSYEKFPREEEIDLAASQRQGTAVSWMTLGQGFMLSASDSSSVTWDRKRTRAGSALSPGPCQADTLLGSVWP